MTRSLANTEILVKTWLRASAALAAMVPLPGGVGPAIFLAMPKGAPNPCILISQVSGGPSLRKDIPEQVARISFDVYGPNRTDASAIAVALMELLHNLGSDGSYSDGLATIFAADVVGFRWQPDPDSDTPRYIVDALITTVT